MASKAVNIRTWHGSASATVTEMANAGRRGKKCRVLRVQGWFPNGVAGPEAETAGNVTHEVISLLDRTDESTPFDLIAQMVRAIAAKSNRVDVYDQEIRGIDAPRPVLSAGIDGVWSGKADNDGIFLRDLSDANNCPAECTPSGQTNAKAYAVAAKVWDAVRAAKSMHEAGQILRAAGAKLHYWCMMD